MNEQINNWLRFHTDEDSLLDSTRTWYGDIRESKNGDFIEVPYCTFSDYSGTTVERSNCETFYDMFKQLEGTDLWMIHGGYSTTGVLIRKSLYLNNPEVMDVIDDLFEYPVISEDAMSQLEIELEQVSWDSWLEYDLKREIDEQKIEYNEDDLQSDMYYVMEYCNEYFIHEDACCPYLDTEKIVTNWVDAMNERRAE